MTKTLLVTGASRGIGRDVALCAGERGWDVAVNYAGNRDKAEAVAAEIRGHGQRAVAIQADVSKPEDVERLFATVDDAFGRLHGLVNNAGIGRSQGPFENCLPENLVATFEVNVFGLFYCAQAAVRRMSTKHGGAGGSIVNVSSAASRTGGVNAFIDYAASKSAVDTITTGLAREVGDAGIRVNAVRPGVTETEMIEHVRATDPSWLDQVVKTMPMGRIGEVREIANPILWLLSDEASYVTGTIVDASGGRATP
ncbi:MAG: SDR family oxidoreductase [Pseudomonadota bacterium]|nr:SDR family oxidoreductase [Pseudomonadota bacterium]